MTDEILEQLTEQVERAVQPIRASGTRKREIREELLAHVLAVFEVEAAGLGDERAALQRTFERFGDPAELAGSLQDSLAASGYAAWLADLVRLPMKGCGVVNHNRLYNLLLGVFGVSVLCTLGVLLFLLGMTPESRPRMHAPPWSLLPAAALNGLYLLAMAATLGARFVNPAAGKRLTRVLNLLFLVAPPFGTLLGVYGLWKVDRVGS